MSTTSADDGPAPSLSRLSKRDSRRISASTPAPLSKSFSIKHEAKAQGNSVELPPSPSNALVSRQQSIRPTLVQQNGGNATNRSTRFDRSRRRMTKVDPNLSISDITKISRTTEIEKKKLEPINRKEVFKFECSGDIKSDTKLKGMHVSWKATFDRPIEELIYPSLQRFDNDNFEEKRKQYENLHGHTRQGYSALGRTMKLDMLDGVDNSGPRMMFIHAPKWTMKLENRNALAASPNRSPNKSHDALNESSLDAGDSLTLSVDDLPPGMDFLADKSHLYRDLYEEIEAEGEKYLREKVIQRFHARLEEEELRKKMKAEEDNFFNVTLPRSRQVLLSNSLPPVKEGDGDHLVRSYN